VAAQEDSAPPYFRKVGFDSHFQVLLFMLTVAQVEKAFSSVIEPVSFK
jgi:hypothetical protein